MKVELAFKLNVSSQTSTEIERYMHISVFLIFYECYDLCIWCQQQELSRERRRVRSHAGEGKEKLSVK